MVDFDFSNGHVRIEDPLIVQLPTEKSQTTPLRLWHPVLIGHGGGGAVFAFDSASSSSSLTTRTTTTPPLVKISWSDSANSVRKECQILQYLESKNVPHIEQCWASLPYPHNDNDKENRKRVMIVVAPYVPHAVASVRELASPALQRTAVQDICQFWVQMLANQVITIDVQPLMEPSTGHVTFIDMTEAQILAPSAPLVDPIMLATSFCNEIMALIPEEWTTIAADMVRDEMQRASLSPRIEELLYSVID